jgi:RNA polymerase sigma-70 factor (ECF subfamily)
MLRKRRSSKEVSLDEDFQSDDGKLPIEIADWAPNPEDLYQATQLREILRKTLQKLGPGLRIVFVLRDIEGFSLEQTAEALGLSVVAVKARTFRARLQLRERLSRYFRRAEEFGQPNPVAVGRAPCASSDISRNTSPTSVANEAAKAAL